MVTDLMVNRGTHLKQPFLLVLKVKSVPKRTGLEYPKNVKSVCNIVTHLDDVRFYSYSIIHPFFLVNCKIVKSCQICVRT